jgi:hypothetical protein
LRQQEKCLPPLEVLFLFFPLHFSLSFLSFLLFISFPPSSFSLLLLFASPSPSPYCSSSHSYIIEKFEIIYKGI